MYKKINLIIIACSIYSLNVVAQKQIIKPDFSDSKNFQTVNRSINIRNESGKVFVHLDAKPHAGVAWISNTNFTAGIIEFDVKGKNIMQQSFVGLAFHGLNDSTYEAVYFRPFNFQSPDTTRKNHSVQYISLPQYDWPALREKYPGKYENALTKRIKPEQWFHAKIIVSNEQIEVFVNNDGRSSLIVAPLSNKASSKIGFWVGNDSDGDFSNLTIKKN